MRVKRGMVQRRNDRARETGEPQENPLTRGIVRHNSHMRKSGNDPARNRTREVMMDQRRNVRAGGKWKTPEKNPPTSDIVRPDCHTRKCGSVTACRFSNSQVLRVTADGAVSVCGRGGSTNGPYKALHHMLIPSPEFQPTRLRNRTDDFKLWATQACASNVWSPLHLLRLYETSLNSTLNASSCACKLHPPTGVLAAVLKYHTLLLQASGVGDCWGGGEGEGRVAPHFTTAQSAASRSNGIFPPPDTHAPQVLKGFNHAARARDRGGEVAADACIAYDFALMVVIWSLQTTLTLYNTYTNNITLTPTQHRHKHQTHDGHLTKRQQPSAPLSPERMAGHCSSTLRLGWSCASKSRSEGVIRATLTRSSSASSLLRARRAVFPSHNTTCFCVRSYTAGLLSCHSAKDRSVPSRSLGRRRGLCAQTSPDPTTRRLILLSIRKYYPTCINRAHANWLDYLLTTYANRTRFLGGPLPDFRKWESCRTVPLVGGVSRGSPVSLALHSGNPPYLPRFTFFSSQDLDKTCPGTFDEDNVFGDDTVNRPCRQDEHIASFDNLDTSDIPGPSGHNAISLAEQQMSPTDQTTKHKVNRMKRKRAGDEYATSMTLLPHEHTIRPENVLTFCGSIQEVVYEFAYPNKYHTIEPLVPIRATTPYSSTSSSLTGHSVPSNKVLEGLVIVATPPVQKAPERNQDVPTNPHIRLGIRLRYKVGLSHFTSPGRYSLSAGVDRSLVRDLGHPVSCQLACGGEEKLTPPSPRHPSNLLYAAKLAFFYRIPRVAPGSCKRWDLFTKTTKLTAFDIIVVLLRDLGRRRECNEMKTE
ncbi:hypothetical protein PR048_019588 [Dryococelus australis]|uniref:Uncharacterized protein n=1 Tax=Dryococelus australis TaxID=614101 RepID=A0ABQ9H401_9NEOP|nr:hypothetical protein PR048_019588 [Dryococelus australis]